MHDTHRSSAQTIAELRERLRAALRGPDGALANGWSSCPIDAKAIFAAVPSLRLRAGWKLCAYVYRADGESRGVIWALPEDAEAPVVKAEAGLAWNGPRPLRSTLIEGAIEGDGSASSYLHASILIREADAFADPGGKARWHSEWNRERAIDAPPDDAWARAEELPPDFDWAPRVATSDDGEVVVTFCTLRREGPRRMALLERIDRYHPGSYERTDEDWEKRIDTDVDEQDRIPSTQVIETEEGSRRVARTSARMIARFRDRIAPLMRGPESYDEVDESEPKTAEGWRRKYQESLASSLEDVETRTRENGWRSAFRDVRITRRWIRELPPAVKRSLARRPPPGPGGALPGPDDFVDDGWSQCHIDTPAIFAQTPGLWLSPEWTLVAYVYRSGSNGNGVVWALPVGSSAQPAVLGWRRARLYSPPRPADAAPFSRALRGDGSAASYLRASLLRREIAELGALWHGSSWGEHGILDTMPDLPWVRDAGLPPDFDWKPRAEIDAQGEVTVTMYTLTRHVQERVIELVDHYRLGSYEPTAETTSRDVAVGGPGYVH